MKRIFITLIAIFMVVCSYGQGGTTIYGCVYGAKRAPISGAVIATIDDKVICTTDENGQFMEEVSEYVISEVVIHHANYRAKVVKVGNSAITVKLRKARRGLLRPVPTVKLKDEPEITPPDEEEEKEKVLSYEVSDQVKLLFNFGDNVSVDEHDYNEYLGTGEIRFREPLTKIVKSAFYQNKTLKRVTIPNGVTSIDDYAFAECDKLEVVTCNAIVPPTAINADEWHAFDNNADGRVIYVPQESVDLYKNADGWKNYKNDIKAKR